MKESASLLSWLSRALVRASERPVKGRDGARHGGYGMSVPFSDTMMVVQGLASLDQGSNENRIFHEFKKRSTAIA
jgi:hypothetical protein